jgi:dCTP deaminase
MSVLPDHEIDQACMADGKPLISPYTHEQLQPASYDVRLGSRLLVPDRPSLFPGGDVIDLELPLPDDLYHEIDISSGFVLNPMSFVLGETIERVCIPNTMVGRIEGKSSIGRLGQTAHITAGYLDPGFSGKITLEIANLFPRPMRLIPGMRFAQLGFEWMSSACQRPYGSAGLNSHYQNAEGVEPSRYGA